MHVLIIGGSSYFGKIIVELLLEAGHQVTLFTRGNQRPTFWDQTRHIIGDRTDAADFAAKLRGRSFDAVIDNIAFNADHVSQALDVLRGQIGRYVLTSSTAVYWSGSFMMPLSEDDVNHDIEASSGLSDYELGKVWAERTLIRQNAVPYTIIRPPLVLGPQEAGHIYFYVQRLLDRGPVILSNSGAQAIRLSFWRDVAAAYPLVLENPQAANNIYNVAQHEIATVADWVKIGADALDIVPDLVGVPDDVMVACGLDYEEPWLFKLTLLPDTSKIERELGYRASPLREWLSEMAHYYRDEYDGPDSDGYDHREQEIAFANRFRNIFQKL